MEVILPVEITLTGFLTTAFINPLGLFARYKSWIVLSSGRLENDWQRILFAEHKPASRRELFNWARLLLVGHTLIVVQAVFTGCWMLVEHHHCHPAPSKAGARLSIRP